METTRIARLTSALNAAFAPEILEIQDDSARHAGHAAMKGITGCETHLQVKIRAEALAGLSRVEQHRAVQKVCESEMRTGLHALQITIL